MRNTLITLLFIFWLVLSGTYLYIIGIFKSGQINHFKTDNVTITFDYPYGWKTEIQGDLSDNKSDKVVLLSNKNHFVIILKQSFSSPNYNQCEKYNDCEFMATHQNFIYSTSEFDLINQKYQIYIPKNGGIDYSWDSLGNPRLLSADMAAGNSYDVYQLTTAGKLTSYIQLDNTITLQVAYQINDEIEEGDFVKTKMVLKQVIDSFSW